MAILAQFDNERVNAGQTPEREVDLNVAPTIELFRCAAAFERVPGQQSPEVTITLAFRDDETADWRVRSSFTLNGEGETASYFPRGWGRYLRLRLECRRPAYVNLTVATYTPPEPDPDDPGDTFPPDDDDDVIDEP